MRAIFLSIIIFFMGVPVVSAETVVYLIRHAETAGDTSSGGTNPDLNAVGQARAAWIANFLADKNIKHVMTTDYARTQQTAAPTVEKTGAFLSTYDPRNLEDLAGTIMGMSHNMMVMGHSNTTPMVVNMLIDEDRFEALPHWQYDVIYKVTYTDDDEVLVEVLHSEPRSSEDH